jgi:hypothetical protein
VSCQRNCRSLVGPARYGVAAVEKAYYYLLAHRWECGLLDPAEKALGFRCQELDKRVIVSRHRIASSHASSICFSIKNGV